MHLIFGHFVREFRLYMGIPQKELARRAGMTKGLVSLIELNRFCWWRPNTLERLARAFGLDVIDLRKLLPPKILNAPPTDLGKLIRSARLAAYLMTKEVDLAIDRDPGYTVNLEDGTILGLQSVNIPPLASTLKIPEEKLHPFLSAHQCGKVLPQHEHLKKLPSNRKLREAVRAKKEPRKFHKPPSYTPARLGRPPKLDLHVPFRLGRCSSVYRGPLPPRQQEGKPPISLRKIPPSELMARLTRR